jgi:hypothetical protein
MPSGLPAAVRHRTKSDKFDESDESVEFDKSD